MKTKLTFIALLFSAVISIAQQEMHVTEQLLNSTIRIEAFDKQGLTTGSGFFFIFKGNNKSVAPVIITNKHVVQGSDSIRLFFKTSVNNKPNYGEPAIVTIANTGLSVVQHPNKDIDLVAIPIVPIESILDKKKINIYSISIEETNIASDSIQKKELKSIEDILMIGYPNGLWDIKNNRPIVRKGITATSSFIDYNGKKEFLVDVAAFGGSSGSPVFFYQDIYTDKDYITKAGPYFYLLGVLYAGPLYSVTGELIKTNPTISNVRTNIPMNLGYVIKASEILKFRKIFIHD